MTELLNLTGKDLEREIGRIAKESRPKQQVWTEKEDHILTKLYSKHVEVKRIAKELNRSYESVKSRWKRIGYSR